MSRVLFRKPSQQNINYIDIWSEKIKLLIQTFTLYEPECANFLNCKEKIIGIYRPIFEYINNPELTYVKGNHLDVFILPELPTDKPYNEIFNNAPSGYNIKSFIRDEKVKLESKNNLTPIEEFNSFMEKEKTL